MTAFPDFGRKRAFEGLVLSAKINRAGFRNPALFVFYVGVVRAKRVRHLEGQQQKSVELLKSYPSVKYFLGS